MGKLYEFLERKRYQIHPINSWFFSLLLSALNGLNELSTRQSTPIEVTMKKTDFMHNYPNMIIIYYASSMVLHLDTDAAYLVVMPNLKSRVAGHFFSVTTCQYLQQSHI